MGDEHTVTITAEEWHLAHELLYAVKDVFPDKRGTLEAWRDGIAEAKRLRALLDEKHKRLKVLEAEASGQATSIRPRR